MTDTHVTWIRREDFSKSYMVDVEYTARVTLYVYAPADEVERMALSEEGWRARPDEVEVPNSPPSDARVVEVREMR